MLINQSHFQKQGPENSQHNMPSQLARIGMTKKNSNLKMCYRQQSLDSP